MSPMPAQRYEHDPQREALEWMALLAQAGGDAQRRKAFAQWCQDPDNARAFAALQSPVPAPRPVAPPPRPRPRPVEMRRSPWGKWLAALFLAMLAALAYLYWPLLQRLGSELHTAPGERRSVRLPDGSTLHMEGASAMNVDLRGRTRQLQLVQGQVALEVKLDGRALEIQVDDALIQVFGTRLAIARYPDHDELLVLSGKAAIRQGGDSRLLSAGERVAFDAARIEPVEKMTDVALAAQRKGRWSVHDQPLQRVLDRLASPRGLRVWVLDDQIANRAITGDFDQNPASDALGSFIADQGLQAHELFGQALIVR